MIKTISRLTLLLCLFLISVLPLAAQEEVSVSLFLDLDVIEKNISMANEGNIEILEAIGKLKRHADEKMHVGPYSVVFSEKNSPLGSIHDYCSMSPYWWPDPERADGLPYIRKDGVVNPERWAYDKTQSSDFRDAVEVLTLAYLYSGKTEYSQRAEELLKIWFVDETTRMNPNMTFAQFVPGKSTGRNYGIIESRVFLYVLDYAGILYSQGELNEDIYHGLMQWTKEFLTWLKQSDHGKKEHAAKNNHGSWYDAQTMGFACLVDDKETMEWLCDGFIERRLSNDHITRDGLQPHELKRTRSYSYSNFNLSAISEFYQLAMNQDVLSKKDARQIRKGILRAANYLYPFALDPSGWPYKQIKSFEGGNMRLAQTFLILDKLHSQKKYFNKALEIPLSKESKEYLLLRYDFNR